PVPGAIKRANDTRQASIGSGQARVGNAETAVVVAALGTDCSGRLIEAQDAVMPASQVGVALAAIQDARIGDRLLPALYALSAGDDVPRRLVERNDAIVTGVTI